MPTIASSRRLADGCPTIRCQRCAGVYIWGCQRAFSEDNNIVITKMVEGSEGERWNPPVQLTTGLSVVTINSGVPPFPFPFPPTPAPVTHRARTRADSRATWRHPSPSVPHLRVWSSGQGSGHTER